MWSVLSNLLCAILIFTIGPFRIGDMVELVDTLDKPGVKGRVVAINLMFTTLIETPEAGGALVSAQQPVFPEVGAPLAWQRSVSADGGRKAAGRAGLEIVSFAKQPALIY